MQSPDARSDGTGGLATPDSTSATPDSSNRAQPDGAPDLLRTSDADPDSTGDTAPIDAIALPPYNACLGPTLSTAEVQTLCAWGTSVLGPEGTVFQAACLVVSIDAGAVPPPRSALMVDMVVLPLATCVTKILADSSCAYKVEQFKQGIEAFKAGDCGAGAGLALVSYATGDAAIPDARAESDASDGRATVDASSDGYLSAKDERWTPVEPGFGLADPGYAVNTARDPSLPIVLKATTPSAGTYSFGDIFKDRALGESAIRSLVTLTDMKSGVAIAYSIGTPVSDGAATPHETLTLTPVAPLSSNGWYRVTVNPGGSQSFVACRTTSRLTSSWSSPTELTAPDITDFYTYSRPMVEEVLVVYKGTVGYVDIFFSEALSGTDLNANPTAQIAIDGATLSGCIRPYACSTVSTGAYDLQTDLQAVPTSFEQITLRIPHAIKAASGGTILDGAVGNPYATIDGDWAAYTFKAADMLLTDSGSVKRWYYLAH